jgi:hypothetical protein
MGNMKKNWHRKMAWNAGVSKRRDSSAPGGMPISTENNFRNNWKASEWLASGESSKINGKGLDGFGCHSREGGNPEKAYFSAKLFSWMPATNTRA